MMGYCSTVGWYTQANLKMDPTVSSYTVCFAREVLVALEQKEELKNNI